MQWILILMGRLRAGLPCPLHCFLLALGHVIFFIGTMFLLAYIYLNPAHPLKDGWNSTSHMRLPFHFLPWTACPHSLGIWPKLPSHWPSLCTYLLTPQRRSGSSRARSVLPGPCIPRAQEAVNTRSQLICPSKPLSPLPAAKIKKESESTSINSENGKASRVEGSL